MLKLLHHQSNHTVLILSWTASTKAGRTTQKNISIRQTVSVRKLEDPSKNILTCEQQKILMAPHVLFAGSTGFYGQDIVSYFFFNLFFFMLRM